MTTPRYRRLSHTRRPLARYFEQQIGDMFVLQLCQVVQTVKIRVESTATFVQSVRRMLRVPAVVSRRLAKRCGIYKGINVGTAGVIAAERAVGGN